MINQQQFDLDQTIRDALDCLPAHSRDIWVQAGMAIHSEIGDAGYYLWENWSRRDNREAPHGYNPRDAKAVWQSFRRAGGINIGTLWAVAKEWGWTPQTTAAVKNVDTVATTIFSEGDKDYMMRTRDAAILAQRIVATCTVDTHPYLETKGFPSWKFLVATEESCAKVLPPRHAVLGWLQEGPLLTLPMRNMNTQAMQTIQFIMPDGTKKFLPGGKASHATYRFGPSVSRGPRWYCEGFATGVAIHEALGILHRKGDNVFVCFSAGGLRNVARANPSRNRGFAIADHDEYICASPDCHHRWTAPWGQKQCPKCQEELILPPTGERYARESNLPFWFPPEPKTDAHDYAVKHGYRNLAEQLRSLAVY